MDEEDEEGTLKKNGLINHVEKGYTPKMCTCFVLIFKKEFQERVFLFLF